MTDNWAIQVSPRVGDTLINLRAESGEQMLSILSWYEQNATTIASALQGGQAQGAVAAAFPGSQNVPQPEQSWGQQPPQSAPPQWSQPPAQPQAAPQAGPGPSCVHGAMVARSGNKNGKAWSGYFCPTPKGTPGQCEPQFNRG